MSVIPTEEQWRERCLLDKEAWDLVEALASADLHYFSLPTARAVARSLINRKNDTGDTSK